MSLSPMPGFFSQLKVSKREGLFLLFIYIFSVAIRLIPKLYLDSHLPAFQADVWYRICMAQYILDHWKLPEPDIRYLAYGYVPMWYPPLSVFSMAVLSKITTLDLPTLCTRLIPFFEGISPLSIYFLARYLYDEKVAFFSTLICALTPSFIYWTGIADPQSMVIFLIPLSILFWLTYARTPSTLGVLLSGTFLGVVFLFHLSYFILILTLLCTTLYISIWERRAKIFLDLFILIIISQAVAAWWWLPRNLYYWWVDVLTSSSQFYTTVQHLTYFGRTVALLAFFSIIFSALKRDKYFFLLFFWALPLLCETQNETILSTLGRLDLSWSTLAKPLEGFRFYVFLAQPLAIFSGYLLSHLIEIRGRWMYVGIFCISLLGGAMAYDLYEYPITGVITNAGMTREEYDAAVWFRNNSLPQDRIIGDYYRAQMMAGVCGGKALLGGLFPLRNIEYPYVSKHDSVYPIVQDDIYRIYTQESLEETVSLMHKYGATHVYYSTHLEYYGYLGTTLKTGFGIPVSLDKFNQGFQVVYRSENVIIFALKTKNYINQRVQ
jgi:hypothetical protein